MGTAYSYARLILAGSLIFWAIWLLFRSSAYPALGIAMGGVGLAVALNETGYVIARFVRGRAEDLQ